MADGVALSIAVVGVGLGLTGMRRSSVLAFGLIGAVSAAAASVWIAYRTWGGPIAIDATNRWFEAAPMSLEFSRAALLFANAVILSTAVLFERAKEVDAATSRWPFLIAVAAGCCTVPPDFKSAAMAFFALTAVAAAAPAAALAVRPMIAFSGGMILVAPVLIAGSGKAIDIGFQQLAPRHVELAGIAAGLAMVVLSIDLRRTVTKPHGFYSVSAVLLGVAAVWNARHSAGSFSAFSHGVAAAACLLAGLANVVWSVLVDSPSSRPVALTFLKAFVRAEAALERGWPSFANQRGEHWRARPEPAPFSLSVFWMLAAAAGIAAVAIASRQPVGVP